MAEIYFRRAEVAGNESAAALVSAIQDRCESLLNYPERGTPRPELGPGLRSVPFRRRAVIAYLVEPDAVVIIGVMYGGRDLAALAEPGRL